MLKQMMRRIFRERRRMAAFSVFSALTGSLLFSGDQTVFLGLPVSLLAPVASAIILPALALVLVLVVPAYRFAVDITGLVLLAYAALSRNVPTLALENAQHPELILLAAIVAVQVLAYVIYGNWSDRYLRRRTHVERALVVSDMVARDAWDALCPTPETAAVYWNDRVEKISDLPKQKDAFRIRYRFEDGKWLDQHVWFDQIRRGKHFRYDFQTIGDTRPGAEKPKTFTVNLEPRAHDVVVHLKLERHNYPVRKALLTWIDDHAGRTYDRAIGAAEQAVDGMMTVAQV